MGTSTALLTDRYELTMLDAALQDGTAARRCVFELFGRRLPGGRRFGVVAGTGRFLAQLRDFRFEESELAFLRDNRIVSAETVRFLEGYRFRGTVTGYREGEVYFPGSPILTIEGTFAEAVVLETLALSILNHDSAVATAAARMSIAAGDRPLAEMGSRRAAERSAVAAARAAYIAGFSATSNLEAGRTWGIPTMGTAAHAWTLLHDSEEDAFRSQIAAFGTATTLLVDTYDIRRGVETAIAVAGTGLGGVRLDSGDLPTVAASVRAQLDELGATSTKITVTSDLDEFAIAALAASPVDSYGVGTSVVTGSGTPTAGMVYKLVARQDSAGGWVAVAKASTSKASVGGRKAAFRTLRNGVATSELVVVADGFEELPTPGSRADARELQTILVQDGELDVAYLGADGVSASREHHLTVREELPVSALALSRADPALQTVYEVSEA
ncbi:nicotinate phosphoribosyltransferase [Microbacterium sp. EYE_5]|uniref:nicotinate phosphoribosyltransferase n=1 Tax=unclassified Microbacterium TaxID=2609290 RepID=UPI0020036B6C|nr:MULTISPECIES: nicotinate phosphoribosyltransferase [unclassified Microbacterium]MCK6080992.1 nicotinate phosphoribosyltransferase [Microbacterium sp. EYE_382]MCK6086262.1 nicotinate phosphoribosyltransferase [Microbacterium sp. EYE_384]MCK6124240.1 nicotinate phosphoribosyltransferase [Microbacterium sp. EYE_80]MCK6127149.1 nicotinate phosphoribosyltransferase [Microbacterium sp. EYE_79]MCK6141947.1 nicotinate phosphoribosyltransferase [Microbacterium sp. EYE_39]